MTFPLPDNVRLLYVVCVFTVMRFHHNHKAVSNYNDFFVIITVTWKTRNAHSLLTERVRVYKDPYPYPYPTGTGTGMNFAVPAGYGPGTYFAIPAQLYFSLIIKEKVASLVSV